MPEKISIDGEYAVEKSSYFVTVSFKDEDGVAVVPKSATWTLTTEDGTVVNSRDEFSISPASEVTIVLSGDDLALSTGFSGNAENRVLTIEAVYDSDLANDLPLRDQLIFPVYNLLAI